MLKVDRIFTIRKQWNRRGKNRWFSPIWSVKNLTKRFSSNSFFSEVENQLEIVNKSIHENEKEFKRLEKEQSQNAAAAVATSTDKSTTPNPTATTSNFVNNFTLEKLDQNDLRRFVRFWNFDEI